MLSNYAAGDVQKFNESVSAYREIIKEREQADRLYEQELLAEGKEDDRKSSENYVSAAWNLRSSLITSIPLPTQWLSIS